MESYTKNYQVYFKGNNPVIITKTEEYTEAMKKNENFTLLQVTSKNEHIWFPKNAEESHENICNLLE